MKENEDYYIDENGNRWTKKYYSLIAAQRASESLINCFNCTDCTQCHDCRNCEHCINCEDCVKVVGVV